MAEIRKRNNTFLISVFVGRDEETQKKIYERITYKPEATTEKAIEKEVSDFAREFEKRVKEGEVYDGEKMTFSQFVKVWEYNFLSQKSKRVQEDYLGKIRYYFLPAFGNMKLSKIKATNIDSVLNGMKRAGKAPKTIRYAYTTINSVMRYAFKKGSIKENPCLRCDDLPTVERDTELHYFTVEQAKRFLNALTLEYTEERKALTRKLKDGTSYEVKGYSMTNTIPLQWQVYFSLAIYGGFRRGEIIALTWKDVDFDKHSISINKAISKTLHSEVVKAPKTKAGIREITLPAETFRLLQKWKREQMELSFKLGTVWKGFRGKDYDNNYIFISLYDGSRMNIDTPSHKFREIIDLYNSQKVEREEDKLPIIRLHDLRHTSATLLLANNTDIETVSKRLGHSKASITLDVYGHAIKEMDNKATETLERIFNLA